MMSHDDVMMTESVYWRMKLRPVPPVLTAMGKLNVPLAYRRRKKRRDDSL
jgi:hypothetical protein